MCAVTNEYDRIIAVNGMNACGQIQRIRLPANGVRHNGLGLHAGLIRQESAVVGLEHCRRKVRWCCVDGRGGTIGRRSILRESMSGATKQERRDCEASAVYRHDVQDGCEATCSPFSSAIQPAERDALTASAAINEHDAARTELGISLSGDLVVSKLISVWYSVKSVRPAARLDRCPVECIVDIYRTQVRERTMTSTSRVLVHKLLPQRSLSLLTSGSAGPSSSISTTTTVSCRRSLSSSAPSSQRSQPSHADPHANVAQNQSPSPIGKHAEAVSMKWEDYFRLRKSRKIWGTVAAVPTSLAGVMIGGGGSIRQRYAEFVLNSDGRLLCEPGTRDGRPALRL